MAHGDDKGLVLPPAIAPLHVVIVPIAKTTQDVDACVDYLRPIIEMMEETSLSFSSQYFDQRIPLRFHIDDDLNHGFGWKCTQYELQ